MMTPIVKRYGKRLNPRSSPTPKGRAAADLVRLGQAVKRVAPVAAGVGTFADAARLHLAELEAGREVARQLLKVS